MTKWVIVWLWPMGQSRELGRLRRTFLRAYRKTAGSSSSRISCTILRRCENLRKKAQDMTRELLFIGRKIERNNKGVATPWKMEALCIIKYEYMEK